MIRLIYQILINLAGPPAVALASLKGRYGGRWRERLGLSFAPRPRPGRPRVWFHGASVGEVRSAAKVVRALWDLRPETEIILSSGTPAGLETAAALFPPSEKRVTILAAPVDFWGAPGRALARLQPSALVIMETELWPNLIYRARAAGLPLILAAARLTPRSFGRYRLVRGFMADLLNRFDLIAPSGQLEYDLYAALGGPSARMKILGNPKFDGLAQEVEGPKFQALKAEWSARLLTDNTPLPLLTAGSTHPGEEELILEAFQKLGPRHPKARLLLAPRHLTRVEEVLGLARSRGFQAEKTGRPGDPPPSAESRVLVLDSFGQLTAIYALSAVVLVGGSLREGLMGHNPLEPAAVAAPLMFGPHMASFQREAEGLLLAGGALETAPDRLVDDLAAWLDEPDAVAAVGRAARAYLVEQSPAAPALARAISDFL